jgi:hypothetical protein
MMDIRGLDEDYVDSVALKIASAIFVPAALQSRFSLDRKSDLTDSFVVAEHIMRPDADLFLQSLAGRGNFILFSPAILENTARITSTNSRWSVMRSNNQLHRSRL